MEFNFFGLLLSDQLVVARAKAKKSIETSDIDTAASDIERAKSRKRRQRIQFEAVDGDELRDDSDKQPARKPHLLQVHSAASSDMASKHTCQLLPPPPPPTQPPKVPMSVSLTNTPRLSHSQTSSRREISASPSSVSENESTFSATTHTNNDPKTASSGLSNQHTFHTFTPPNPGPKKRASSGPGQESLSKGGRLAICLSSIQSSV